MEEIVIEVVGVEGFGPPASPPQTARSDQAELHPDCENPTHYHVVLHPLLVVAATFCGLKYMIGIGSCITNPSYHRSITH